MASILIVAAVIATIFCVWRYTAARKLASKIYQLMETEPWRASVEVTKRVKPRNVVAAQEALASAERRCREALQRMHSYDYEHANVDVKLLQEALNQAIAVDRSAREVHARVTNLYSRSNGIVMSNPFKAFKIYANLNREVELIIQDEVRAANRRQQPISDAELEDFRLALYDGRFDEWVRNLQP